MTYEQERQRCEKIIQNYMARYKNDLRKTEMLKNILSKIRHPSCSKKTGQSDVPQQKAA